MAEALLRLGVERALVISAECGLDEIAPAGRTRLVEVSGGALTERMVSPADFGLAERPVDSVRGGDPAFNARIIRTVLEGRDVPARTGILLNAAAALYAAGAAGNLKDGAELAARTVDSGDAAATLARVSYTAEPQAVAA